MTKIFWMGLSVVGLVAASAPVAQAKDVTTKVMILTDNANPAKRMVQVQSKDPTVLHADAGNPGANGAAIHVYSATDDFCAILPATGWLDKKGQWKHTDKATKNFAQIKDGLLTVKIKSNDTFTLADNGTQGTVNAQVQFGDGTRFCMRCAGNKKDDAKKFMAKDCVAAACDAEPSTCAPPVPCSPTGAILKGALTPTPGRFNYNLTIGLPAALAACTAVFPGTHVCTYTELQNAAAACDLKGLKDTANNAVTSFWAVDPGAPALSQCNDDAPITGSGLNWEYGTAHTVSRGQKVALDNAAGTLGALGIGALGYQAGWFGGATRAPVATPATANFKTLPPVNLSADAANALRAAEELTSHYTRELLTPWALIHAVRGFGRDFTLSDGTKAVDVLCTKYTEEREVNGKRYVCFQRNAEVHENSFLKTFLEAGVSPEQTLRVNGRQYTLREAGEHAKALFRCDPTDLNRYEPKLLEEHLPWGLIALTTLVPPAPGMWTNAFGEQVDLHRVLDRAFAAYEGMCSGLRDSLAKGEMESLPFREAINKHSCFGLHAVYGFFAAYHHGYRRNDMPARIKHLLDLTIYRMEGDLKAIDREADAAKALVDQGADGALHRGGAGEDAGDVLLVDHRRQPVGADQEEVAGLGGDGLDVDLDLGLGAECAGDDRALRVVLGLRVGELALAPHLLDQRVVAGQPFEAAGAEAVGAAVADVADRHLLGLEVDDHRRRRRPHPGQLGVAAGLLVDRPVGAFDRLRQDPLGWRLRQLAVERLGGRLGGDLTRLSAAHPVGDDEDVAAGEERVLVGVALAAGVGAVRLLLDPQRQASSPPAGTGCRRSAPCRRRLSRPRR